VHLSKRESLSDEQGPGLCCLYTILDIFRCMVVGWTIALRESALIAEDVIRDAVVREGIARDRLTLHADRGGPMIAGGVAELLSSLGVTKSHRRPRVSNDYSFVESHFKTLKFQPDYPDRFASTNAAYEWCKAFFDWYNNVRYHSGIGYFRPPNVHANQHGEILVRRRAVLDEAQAAHPERFRRGGTTEANWEQHAEHSNFITKPATAG